MLQLVEIKKNYVMKDQEPVRALRGVSLNFRQNEFVAILGPSGCGKTTLLNIIGGLDRYTSGDLIIKGKSTKQYNDRDWDTYRNHSIGFVFQSYNLISHQTILKNVELALTIAGVDRNERKERAMKALAQVGLKGMEKKRPNQLSGGQMQRVAIARALFSGEGDDANMPTTELSEAELGDGIGLLDLLVLTKLAASKGEGRRLIEQGGLSINGKKVTDVNLKIKKEDLSDPIKIKKGKKAFHKVVLK